MLRTIAICLALLGLPALSAVGAEDADDAARAFAAGRHAEALRLYDKLLAAHPDDPLALLRSGKLLSWEKRFDEALDRYERLLRLQPDHREAALERAKVLSWAGRNADAADAFYSYLDGSPGDLDARTALARCLSWDGSHEAAREEFDRVLAQRPDDVPALVGTARTHAWGGDHRAARSFYERALAVAPGDLDARVGLAYLELWSGDPARAAALARALQAEHPGNPDVEELMRRTAAARGPWLRAGADRLEDTDDNQLDVYTVRAGWALPRGVDLSAGVARYEMHDPTGDARIDHAGAELTFHPGRGQLLTVTAGVDERETTAGESERDAVGGLHCFWGRDRPWRAHASAQRQSLRYSRTITDNGILIDEAAAGVDGRAGTRWRVHAGVAVADYSDDNDRLLATAGFSRTLLEKALRLSAGIGLRYMDFGEDTDGGYFDPQEFTAGLAHLRGSGAIGARQRYRFALESGWQSFTLGGVETDNDFVVIVSAGWVFELGAGIELDLRGEWGDYAGLSAAGFESRQVGLSLGWRGGDTP